MVKRKRVTRVTSNENSTQHEVKTPEQPKIMHQSRPHTRSQTKSLSGSELQPNPELDSHIEQHGGPTEPKQDASVERHQSPKHLGHIVGHRTPRTATISYEEFCNGVHSYVEAQHGAPTEPEQETPENLQVVPMDLEHTPQDLEVKIKSIGSASKVTILGPSGESKSTQGLTRLSHIWNLPEGYRVAVEFSSDFQPIKHGGGLLRRFLGAALRKPHLIPINFKTWRKVPLTYKEGLWDIIKSKFEIPVAQEREIKKILLQKVGYMWRGHKCSLKTRYFDEDKSMEEVIANVPPRVDQEQWASLVALWNTKDMKVLSQANKAVCKKQRVRHTTGTKSIAEVAEEMKEKDDVAPTLAELFISTHKRKDGTARNENSAKKIAAMEKLLARHDDDANGRTVNNGDVNSPAMPRKSSFNKKMIGKKKMEAVKDRKKAQKGTRKGKEVMDKPSRKRAEEDRREAREDRKQAEEDRRQAREDRKHAEEERKKAEEERKKSDEEIRFLKERLAWMESLVSRLLPVTDTTTVPSEVPRLKSGPSNKVGIYSATSSHAHEHCSPDQDLR